MAIFDFNTALLPGVIIDKPYNPQKTRVIVPEPGSPDIWTIPEIPYQAATPEIPAISEIPFRAGVPELVALPYQPAQPEILYQPAKYGEPIHHPATTTDPEYWEQGPLLSAEVPYQAAIPEVPARPYSPAVPEQAFVPGHPAIPAKPEVKYVPALEMITLTCITTETLSDGHRVEISHISKTDARLCV
jgi:hypothetical protein